MSNFSVIAFSKKTVDYLQNHSDTEESDPLNPE